MTDLRSLLEIVLVAIYTLLLVQRKNNLSLLTAFAFVAISMAIRLSVDVSAVRDFRPYFESFQDVKYGLPAPELAGEPYRYLLFRGALLFGDLPDRVQIDGIYYFHFLVVTAFFLWIAYLRDVGFEVKLILFLAFYPVFAYVWIRAGMAYVLAGVLFYTITTGKWRILHYTLPMFHSSSLAFLLVMKVKEARMQWKLAILLAAGLLIYAANESNYVRYLIYKLERYDETSDARSSSALLLFHLVNIGTFLYLAAINARFRNNFAILGTMGAYMLMYHFNPVVGLRVFPFVLIACVAERIQFTRYKLVSLVLICGYMPVYLARFDQILL